MLSLNTVGLNDLISSPGELQVFQNIPNPAGEKTKILIYLPESSNLSIEVSVLNGKQVASLNQELKRGYHSFLFTPQGAENYILTANCRTMRKSIKIVSTVTRHSQVCTLVYNAAENETIILKSSEMINKFKFTIGDLLDCKGYHNGISAPLQDAPLTNQTYTLNFSPTGTPCTGILTVSYLGQTYNTVKIGTQCWFRENLNIGTRIDGVLEQTDNGIIEKYCADDIDANCKIYGGLYQWNEMMQYVTTSGVKGICPSGWHVPTDADWTKLMAFLGGESLAGGKMKYAGTFDAGTGLWAAPNSGASNNSGFTALPAGGRTYNGSFNSLGFFTDFWSSTIGSNTETAWDRNLNYNYGNVYRSGFSMTYGFSCRCLKD